MAKLCVFFSLFVFVSAAAPYSDGNAKPLGDPITAIEGLVTRILGKEYVAMFEFEVISDAGGYDVFEIDADTQAEKPILRGNNGVSLASALNFYLKYSCNCSISWGRDGTGDQLRLPQPLPLPGNPLRVVSPVKYRYMYVTRGKRFARKWWIYV